MKKDGIFYSYSYSYSRSRSRSRSCLRSDLNAFGYSIEYLGMSRVKGNYQKMYHKGWEQKARIYSFKSVMNALTP
jgi:hypothetical protein